MNEDVHFKFKHLLAMYAGAILVPLLLVPVLNLLRNKLRI